MHAFLWTFEYQRKRRVNKAIKEIALTLDASDAYIFRNNYLKKFIFKLPKYFFFISILVYFRIEWDIVLSSSYDGWDKLGYTMCCPCEGTTTLPNYSCKSGANSEDLEALCF